LSIAGIGLYAKHCAVCHGTAKDDASMTALAKGLCTQPPQLATAGVEDDRKGDSFSKIRHGIR
jgi:mono/diheme cytochrome c family protein